MVLGIGGGEQRRQFQETMQRQAEAQDNQLVANMHDPANVAYDPQVSAMILEANRRFLNWRFDPNTRQLICMEKYQYKEPYMDEPLSFLTDEERLILNQLGNTLSIIYQFGQKYDLDMSGTFNQIANVRQDLLLGSRSTGKAMKISKSQYVESTASIQRSGTVGGGKKKLFGLI